MRPSAIMLPHVGVLASTLAPRMASVPSATIATAMPSSAIEYIAGSTFGSTSRKMMRRFFAPWAFAASTNSRCDHESVLARVIRPSTGIDTMPIAMMSASFGVEPRVPARGARLGAQDGDEREGEDHRGDRQEHVEHERHDGVDPAAEVAAEQAERAAEHEADQHRDGRDDQRRAPRPQQAGQHVAADAVAAEQVAGRGADLRERAAPGDVGDQLLRVVDGEVGREDRAADHEREPRDREPRREAEPAPPPARLGAGPDRGHRYRAAAGHADGRGVARDPLQARRGRRPRTRGRAQARRILGSSTM